MFIVILSQNDVGKLLLMLSCANRKFDNLMSSANFKISHLLYKGLTDGLVWWLCIGAEVELDNSTEIWLWYSFVKMSQWLKPLFSGRYGGGIPRLQEVEVLGQKHFSEKCIKYQWVSIFRLDHPWLLCIMLYTCSYFLSYGCLQDDFFWWTTQKSFLTKINLFALCFIMLFRGGGGCIVTQC